ncbi:hypothetical protein [Shewanella loihica]|uniref:hypothetical protein n=1 Tax=Shewanella loihica TaxID=359303 RepID=UPI00059E2E81|nr:hypothetical protein [Shewanella loihica]
MSDILMNQRELLKWSQRLAEDDWSHQVWENLVFSGACASLWLICIFTLVACLVPPIRRLIHSRTGVYLPWNICVGVWLITGLIGIMGWPSLFTVGVLAYWVNATVPGWLLEPVAEFTQQFFTAAGWFIWRY